MDTHDEDRARIAKARERGGVLRYCGGVHTKPYGGCSYETTLMLVIHWTDEVQEYRYLCLRHANWLRSKGVRVTLDKRK